MTTAVYKTLGRYYYLKTDIYTFLCWLQVNMKHIVMFANQTEKNGSHVYKVLVLYVKGYL